MYNNYIFDLYGTLVEMRTDETKKKLWKNLALFFSYNGAVYCPKELKKAYNKKIKEKLKSNKKTVYPDVKITEVFKELYTEKSAEVSEETIIQSIRIFRILSTEYIGLYDGVVDMLKELKAQGKKIYMLSNGQREFTVPELKYLGIHEYFDGLYSSSDLEICKPDPLFFNYLIEKEGLEKDESIFIGNDHLCDVAGAKASYLDCLYLHSNNSRKVKKVDSTYAIWDGKINKIIETVSK